jgi:hypothetical protein
MMKKRMKALLAIGLSAIIMVCSAGCGNGKEHMKAETDPDTPVERKSRAVFYYQCTCNIYTGT